MAPHQHANGTVDSYSPALDAVVHSAPDRSTSSISLPAAAGCVVAAADEAKVPGEERRRVCGYGRNVMGKLDGVRAVVTGGTSGLGAAMARALLAAGARVAVAGRPGERLQAGVARWRDQGLAAEALPLDVRDPAAAEQAAAAIRQRWRGLDLVVNNAGIGMRTVNPRFLTEPQPFWQVPADGFTDVVATNLTGYFLVSRAFAPLFLEQGEGRFVNVTVNQETMRRRGFVPYGPSRAGAEALSLIMTEDLRPYGIAVNLLLPGGATATGMIPEGLSDEQRRHLLSPDVMGPPIVFLASPAAEGLTGERIVANEWDQWLAAYHARSRRDR
jgi:NAD(P)-dependent dehydrogenase (short-subunit alcohol dehydrogenase family)